MKEMDEMEERPTWRIIFKKKCLVKEWQRSEIMKDEYAMRYYLN